MTQKTMGQHILEYLDGTGPQELCQVIRACRSKTLTGSPSITPPTRAAVYGALLALRASGDVEQITDIDGIIYYQLSKATPTGTKP